MWKLIFIFFILLNILAFFVPKKIKKSEIYSTTIFALAFGMMTDEVLDLHYDLYGYFIKGFQWKGFIGAILCFIPTNILFLNFYPYHKNWKAKVMYTLVWSLFSLVFEWLTLQTDFFYHNGWKLWYSALAYPAIFQILVINLKIIRRLSK
jgi:hypothetical protein